MRSKILLFAVLCTVATTVQAASMSSAHKYAWGEKTGWINFNPTHGNVVVTGTGMTGSAWNDIYGWINLHPTRGGVVNDGNGNLSGYAWGEQAGWINFNGVSIDSSGIFHGTASSDILGSISFNCARNNSCGSSNFYVQGEWLAPASSASSESSSSSSSIARSYGGGGRRGNAAAVTTGIGTNASIPDKVTPVFKIRTCDRVMKWFKGNNKMLERVNARLEKRFGFTCRK